MKQVSSCEGYRAEATSDENPRENPIIHLCRLNPRSQGALEQSLGLVTMCQHQ